MAFDPNDTGPAGAGEDLELRVRDLEGQVEDLEAETADLFRLHLQVSSIVETVFDPVLVLDPRTGTVSDSNEAARDLLGYSEEEFAEVGVRELCPGAEAPDEFLSLVVRDGRTDVPGVVCRRRDGSRVPVDTSACRIDRSGRPAVLVTLRERRPCRRVRRQILESDERYRSLFHGLTDPACFCDRDGVVVDGNPAFRAFTGIGTREPGTRPRLRDLLLGREDRERLDASLDAEAEPGEIPARIRAADGTPRNCRLTAIPRRDLFGRITGHVCILRDTSAREAAEERLRRSEEHFRSLIENTQDVISVVDPTGRILYQSPSVRDLVGRDPGAQIGRNILENIPPPDRAAARSAIAAGFASGRVQELVHRIVCEDGMEKICQSVGRTYGSAETGRRAVISTRDVTDRKRLEEQLRQSEKLLALGELVSGVAHELNNPLTGVLGFAQLIRQLPDLPARAARYLEPLTREAGRAARIVQNLLTFARRRKPERRLVDPNELLDRVLELRAYEMRVSDIEVTRRLATDLPPVWLDEDQIQQVFMNVVINAEQAIAAGRGRGRLEVESAWDAESGRVRIRLANDGPPIPPAVLSRIFDPFFSTKPEGKGTGLGLSISCGILNEHGGRITAENEGDRGVAFAIELPTGTPPETLVGEGPSNGTDRSIPPDAEPPHAGA